LTSRARAYRSAGPSGSGAPPSAAGDWWVQGWGDVAGGVVGADGAGAAGRGRRRGCGQREHGGDDGDGCDESAHGEPPGGDGCSAIKDAAAARLFPVRATRAHAGLSRGGNACGPPTARMRVPTLPAVPGEGLRSDPARARARVRGETSAASPHPGVRRRTADRSPFQPGKGPDFGSRGWRQAPVLRRAQAAERRGAVSRPSSGSISAAGSGRASP
jgi:hypothetical protein